MKFKLSAQDLNEALGVVGVVSPRPLTAQGGSGFLFVARGDRCFIYSRDSQHQTRADVPIEDLDTEGSFIYPSDKVSSFKYLDGWIEFESGHDETDDRYWVRYHTESGATEERSTLNPRLLQALDESLEAATSEFKLSVGLLREALSTTKPFLAKVGDARAPENFKTLQLFDYSKDAWKAGNGYFFAADGIRACYFYCKALEDKGLSIHGQHLPQIMSFLSKCGGTVTIKQGQGITFATNGRGQVLGWAHHVRQHDKFSYYSYKKDSFILKVPKDPLTKALRFVRAGLDPKKDKIRVSYKHQAKTLQFFTSEGSTSTVESMPVGITTVTDDALGGGTGGDTTDFSANININQLLELVEPLKSFEVSLRVAIVPSREGRKEAFLFRTVEDYYIGTDGKLLINADDDETAYECQVTRFMPSRE